MSIEPEIVPEPIATILHRYCNVNAFDPFPGLRDDIRDGHIPSETVALFREQLRQAAYGRLLTPKQYKALTDDNEYNTPEELQAWLHELWQMIFPDEPLEP